MNYYHHLAIGVIQAFTLAHAIYALQIENNVENNILGALIVIITFQMVLTYFFNSFKLFQLGSRVVILYSDAILLTTLDYNVHNRSSYLELCSIIILIHDIFKEQQFPLEKHNQVRIYLLNTISALVALHCLIYNSFMLDNWIHICSDVIFISVFMRFNILILVPTVKGTGSTGKLDGIGIQVQSQIDMRHNNSHMKLDSARSLADEELNIEIYEYLEEGVIILQPKPSPSEIMPYWVKYMNSANKRLFKIKDKHQLTNFLAALQNLQFELDDVVENKRDSVTKRDARMCKSLYLQKNQQSLKNSMKDMDQFESVTMSQLLQRIQRQKKHCSYIVHGLLTIDNQEKMMEFSLFNYDPLIMICRDVTHRQKIKYLKEYDLQKSKTLSFVSHEYRTPLTCIISMLEMVINSAITEEQKTYCEAALESSYYILNLSNDLLDLAQIKAGKFKMQTSKVNLHELCLDCMKMFKLQSKTKNINLECQFNYRMSKFILSDKNRLKQIITNLISNAFKFTLKGSISIIVQQVDNKLLRVSVKDTGIGISEADQNQLFKAFGKSNSEESRKLNSQGVGLGLVISNQIAQQLSVQGHGLQIESNLGSGSTFFFDLDLTFHLNQKIPSIKLKQVQLEIDQQDDSTIKEKATSDIEHKCQHILIVDDNQFNIKPLKMKLKQLGCEDVDESTNGRDAIQMTLTKKCGFRCPGYKLVLMDLEMPIVDGKTATKQIKLERPKQIIVACSGHDDDDEKQQCISIGMDGYLVKPVEVQCLSQILTKFL